MTWRHVPKDAWRPRGISNLEPNAWAALRSDGSTSVVAGPGAGKTEFLAQRAAYLLETGMCPAPKQILAISFKTDSAANLAARVRERCPPELAGRLVSLTFDAFTKSLVDRFQAAVPKHWQPTKPYEIVFPTKRDTDQILAQIRDEAKVDWQHDIAGLNSTKFESDIVGKLRLTIQPPQIKKAVGFAVLRWWQRQLLANPASRLTFVSLNRLAELVLRANPQILRAVRMTYPFVFVDEFQDTTFAQYDFLLSAFGARTTVTAVGDHKQRIMGWAGARTDAFEQFEADFGAKRENLLFNFRSSPALVSVQHVVATALDAGAIPMKSQAAPQLDEDVVQVWTSSARSTEGDHLAEWIARDMATRGTRPRDYVLLVRQKADQFEEELRPRFARCGLSLRNESGALGKTTLQDLMADESVTLAVAALRLGASKKDVKSWSFLVENVFALREVDVEDDVARHKAERGLEQFLASLRKTMRETAPSDSAADEIAQRLFAFLDVQAIQRTYSAYARNELLPLMLEAFGMHLRQCAQDAASWSECLDRFVGTNDVPLMTVHKSKGLEYDTVLFVGLDDQSWWSHSRGNPEGIATFFVALSRAKQRAVFMFCESRGTRQKVADLYQLLKDAGVPETAIG